MLIGSYMGILVEALVEKDYFLEEVLRRRHVWKILCRR